jgi:hypothetical protein
MWLYLDLQFHDEKHKLQNKMCECLPLPSGYEKNKENVFNMSSFELYEHVTNHLEKHHSLILHNTPLFLSFWGLILSTKQEKQEKTKLTDYYLTLGSTLVVTDAIEQVLPSTNHMQLPAIMLLLTCICRTCETTQQIGLAVEFLYRIVICRSLALKNKHPGERLVAVMTVYDEIFRRWTPKVFAVAGIQKLQEIAMQDLWEICRRLSKLPQPVISLSNEPDAISWSPALLYHHLLEVIPIELIPDPPKLDETTKKQISPPLVMEEEKIKPDNVDVVLSTTRKFTCITKSPRPELASLSCVAPVLLLDCA